MTAIVYPTGAIWVTAPHTCRRCGEPLRYITGAISEVAGAHVSRRVVAACSTHGEYLIQESIQELQATPKQDQHIKTRYEKTT